VWINQGDIILLSLRDFQDDKADVIQKYTADEARNLKAYGELPETAKINETDTFGPGDDDDNVEFDEVSADEDEDEGLPSKNDDFDIVSFLASFSALVFPTIEVELTLTLLPSTG
jgi:hypothetical protein